MARRPPPLPMDAPLECTIRVAGALDRSWSDRLGGLDVRPAAGRVPATELCGRLPDQAALLGVLLALYELGLPLISVACRAAQDGGETPESSSTTQRANPTRT